MRRCSNVLAAALAAVKMRRTMVVAGLCLGKGFIRLRFPRRRSAAPDRRFRGSQGTQYHILMVNSEACAILSSNSRTWGEWAIALHGMVLVPEILLIENLKSILSIWSPHSLHSDSNWRLYGVQLTVSGLQIESTWSMWSSYCPCGLHINSM